MLERESSEEESAPTALQNTYIGSTATMQPVKGGTIMSEGKVLMKSALEQLDPILSRRQSMAKRKTLSDGTKMVKLNKFMSISSVFDNGHAVLFTKKCCIDDEKEH